MARLKKTSAVITAANTRKASLISIDPALDLGNDLTVQAYTDTIAATEAKLETYNTLLSQVDDALNTFTRAETDLSDLSGRMLAGVGVKFGKDSSEYEQAGGTRKSEIKRSPRKPKKPATP